MTEKVGGSSPSSRVRRLYAITRLDLPIGLRTAQVGHALIGWVQENREEEVPENLVVLAVKNETELRAIAQKLLATYFSRRTFTFHEPDLGDQLTAIAAAPECWKALSSLPLLR